MKKVLATVICLVALIVTALPVSAQTRSRVNTRRAYDSRYSQSRNNSTYDRRYDRNSVNRDAIYQSEANSNTAYYDQYYDDRSFWEKHRDKITTAGGAAAGAIIGGLAGGKKGALIGALAGGGGAAVYTYKIRNK